MYEQFSGHYSLVTGKNTGKIAKLGVEKGSEMSALCSVYGLKLHLRREK